MPDGQKIEVPLALSEEAWGAIAGTLGGAIQLGMMEDEDAPWLAGEVRAAHDAIVHNLTGGLEGFEL